MHDAIKTAKLGIADDIEELVFVSDVHGLVEPLDAIDGILAGRSAKVKVVAAGDYFVNGLHPAEALEWVRARAADCAILGNHDEGALNSSETGLPPYTEAGAWERLSPSLRSYLAGMPQVLELTWMGNRIRVSHDIASSGKRLSWRARVPEVAALMADPCADLTVCAHTHYPFVRTEAGVTVANCGAASNLLLGHREENGSIHPKGEEDVFVPVPEMYSTYLSVTVRDGELEAAIGRFRYDLDAVVAELQEFGHPNLGNLECMYRTGVCWC